MGDARLDLDGVDGAFVTIEGLPRPDWDVILKAAAGAGYAYGAGADLEPWTDLVRQWLVRLGSALGSAYAIGESDGFLVLSPFDDRNERASWLDRARSSIIKYTGMPNGDDMAKSVVMFFGEAEQYYSYVSASDDVAGEYIASAGCFISRGYCHVCVAPGPKWSIEHTLLHELVHMLMVAKPNPLWLEEALAEILPGVILDYSPFHVDHEMIERHQACWTPERLAAFWSGHAFGDGRDDVSELAYHLSELVTRRILQDWPKRFKEFFGDAMDTDAGQASALRHLGVGLDQLVADILGPGDWAPDPARICADLGIDPDAPEES